MRAGIRHPARNGHVQADSSGRHPWSAPVYAELGAQRNCNPGESRDHSPREDKVATMAAAKQRQAYRRECAASILGKPASCIHQAYCRLGPGKLLLLMAPARRGCLVSLILSILCLESSVDCCDHLQYPSGRWGNAKSPAYGTLNDYQFMRRHTSNEQRLGKAKAAWGADLTSVEDVVNVFVKYTSGKS